MFVWNQKKNASIVCRRNESHLIFWGARIRKMNFFDFILFKYSKLSMDAKHSITLPNNEKYVVLIDFFKQTIG